MAIIALAGRISSGKDTVGQMIRKIMFESFQEGATNINWKPEPPNQFWQIKKFATKLKVFAAQILGVNPEKFEDQEYKNSYLGPEWNKYRVTGDNGEFLGFYDSYPDNHALSKIDEIPMTVREFLQKLGTDAMRYGLHPNVWVNALFADYKQDILAGPTPNFEGSGQAYKHPNWIITDVRFPNEADAIREKGGLLIQVRRPDITVHTDMTPLHESETALDDYTGFDHVIINDEGLEELAGKVKNILKHHNIIP